MASDRASDFGTKLRAARERKGVSLRQIASKTKISIAVLEALERNDFARLPGGIFSRAFVRSYAVEVGLDPETTIQEFIAQFPHDSVTAGHPTSSQVEDFESLENDRRMATTVLSILAISILLAGAVIYFSMINRRAPAVPEAAPAAVSPTTGGAPEPALAVEPSPTAAPPATPPPATPPPVTRPPASTPAPTPVQPSDAVSDRLTIGLSARGPVWVSATVDGQKTISRLLQAGEKQTIDVKREMVITAGDAAALALTLNGANGRPLGKAGEVVTVRINLTNYKDYLAR
jgi:cytoskeleton protein RodZ